MPKLALLLFISALVIACEKNESVPDPPELSKMELKNVAWLDSLLGVHQDDLREVEVRQWQLNQPDSIRLQVTRDEHRSFEVGCDDYGVTIRVITERHGRSTHEDYFYSHLNIRGWNFSTHVVPGKQMTWMSLTIALTQEYNWRE